jgi:hypothetical protein
MVNDNNHVMNYHCLLMPHSTGTVISLDRLMRNNRNIVKFQQVGTVQGTGFMKFYDKDDREAHAIMMEERNGLWCTVNSMLVPTTETGPTKSINTHGPVRINKLAMDHELPTEANVNAMHFCAAEDKHPKHNEEPPGVCAMQDESLKPK